MKKILPLSGVEIIEVTRFEKEGEAVSASSVRDLIKKSDFAEIKKLVPSSTYHFLISQEAESIIKKIKFSDSRH